MIRSRRVARRRPDLHRQRLGVQTLHGGPGRRTQSPAALGGGRRCLPLADESAAVADAEHRLVRRGLGRLSSVDPQSILLVSPADAQLGLPVSEASDTERASGAEGAFFEQNRMSLPPPAQTCASCVTSPPCRPVDQPTRSPSVTWLASWWDEGIRSAVLMQTRAVPHQAPRGFRFAPATRRQPQLRGRPPGRARPKIAGLIPSGSRCRNP